MSGIICAIRGGPHSQPTIHKAIVTAKQHEISIYFLYVVNLDFLKHTEQSRTQVIQQEMGAMGEFICLKAQIEARREGVQANIAVREGSVTEEIIALCHEIKADYVILGHPQGEHATNIFDLKRLEKFRQILETETGAKVIFSQSDQDETVHE
jgi:nucleotide-binding universal stress UspA family protein